MGKPSTDMERSLQEAGEAEFAILGALFLHSDNPEVMALVMDRLDRPDYFAVPTHREIFKGILELYGEGKSSDVVSVYYRLKEMGLYKTDEGTKYLYDLMDYASLPHQITQHVKIVLNAAIRRKMEFYGQTLISACKIPGQTIDEILLSAEKGLVEIGNALRGDETQCLREIMPMVKEDIKKRKTREVTGLLTGYQDLDQMTNGLHPGELIIVAARPSVGKSALALNIAQNIFERNVPVGFVSLEMTRLENARRLVVSRAKAALPRGQGSTLSEEGWIRIDNSIQELESAPFYINDQTDISITKLKSIATKMRLNYKIELLVVDYLQLLTPGKFANSRNDEVSIISRSLKTLAGSLRIPIIAISQLNRSIESRGDKAQPRLSDLRDSGSLEQDADLVMFLNPMTDDPDNAELIIAKQRNGPRGVINLHFQKEFVRWESGFKTKGRSAVTCGHV